MKNGDKITGSNSVTSETVNLIKKVQKKYDPEGPVVHSNIVHFGDETITRIFLTEGILRFEKIWESLTIDQSNDEIDRERIAQKMNISPFIFGDDSEFYIKSERDGYIYPTVKNIFEIFHTNHNGEGMTSVIETADIFKVNYDKFYFELKKKVEYKDQKEIIYCSKFPGILTFGLQRFVESQINKFIN